MAGKGIPGDCAGVPSQGVSVAESEREGLKLQEI
jgi:hypothetical protein